MECAAAFDPHCDVLGWWWVLMAACVCIMPLIGSWPRCGQLLQSLCIVMWLLLLLLLLLSYRCSTCLNMLDACHCRCTAWHLQHSSTHGHASLHMVAGGRWQLVDSMGHKRTCSPWSAEGSLGRAANSLPRKGRALVCAAQLTPLLPPCIQGHDEPQLACRAEPHDAMHVAQLWLAWSGGCCPSVRK